MSIRRVSILGATGSVGAAAAILVANAPDRFEAVAIAGGRDAEALATHGQARQCQVRRDR